jgi:hypothetical protein
MPKIYFTDTGLRNMVLKNFSDMESRVDTGALIENSVYSNIVKNLTLLEEAHFWRTLSGNEVDFVVLKENKLTPVEVKYSSFKKPRIPAGIRYFTKDHPGEKSFVLNKDFFGRSGNTIFLPVWLC